MKRFGKFVFAVGIVLVAILIAQSIKATRMCHTAIEKATQFELYSDRMDLNKADRERAIAEFVGGREVTEALGCEYTPHHWRK